MLWEEVGGWGVCRKVRMGCKIICISGHSYDIAGNPNTPIIMLYITICIHVQTHSIQAIVEIIHISRNHNILEWTELHNLYNHSILTIWTKSESEGPPFVVRYVIEGRGHFVLDTDVRDNDILYPFLQAFGRSLKVFVLRDADTGWQKTEHVALGFKILSLGNTRN